jgi:hypothetical protein
MARLIAIGLIHFMSGVSPPLHEGQLACRHGMLDFHLNLALQLSKGFDKKTPPSRIAS